MYTVICVLYMLFMLLRKQIHLFISFVLGTVVGAVWYDAPGRQTHQVSGVMTVQLRARSLSDDTRPVTTSQVFQPGAHTLVHSRTLRTLVHH